MCGPDRRPVCPVAGWQPAVSWAAPAGLAGFPGAAPPISPIWAIMRWGRKPGRPELIAGELEWQPPVRWPTPGTTDSVISFHINWAITFYCNFWIAFYISFVQRLCLCTNIILGHICLSVGNNISCSWRRQRERSNKINRLWKHWKVNKFESTASCLQPSCTQTRTD